MASALKRIAIGGIQISVPQALLTINDIESQQSAAIRITRRLARYQINIALLASGAASISGRTCLTLALDDLNKARSCLEMDEGLSNRITIVAPTVSLTLFPTRREFLVMARAWQALEDNGIPILATGASASALILITHLKCQAEAIAALQLNFELPPGATPHQPGIRIVQN